MEKQNRATRENDTRAVDQRPTAWRPPESLPSPNNREGWTHRWIRTGILGSTEFMKQRDAHFAKQNKAQMDSVDNTFMKDNDPRMPLFKESASKVTFGSGS